MRIVLLFLAVTLLFSGSMLLIADEDESKKKEKSDNDAIQLPGAMGLKISGELRFREEIWNHHYRTADPRGRDTYDFGHMRTRLRFDLDVRENLAAIIEFQDVRTLGGEGNTAADTEGVDLKRGEILIKNLFGKPLDLEVGRHVLAYGDQRLIGHLEWADQGRTYDGFRLSYKPGSWYTDFIGFRVNDSAVSDANDQDLLGVYGGINEALPGGGIEAYALLFRDQRRQLFPAFIPVPIPLNMTERRFVTLGVRAFGDKDGFDYTGELAWQKGDDGTCDLDAMAFALVAGYTFADIDWKPRVGVEIDFASGDRNANDFDSERFQTLFPTNHMHYGFADLVGWSNMWDFKAGVQVHPKEKVTVALDWHHLQLADIDDAWIDAGGNVVRWAPLGTSRHLGEEIDLTVGWKPNDNLTLLTGWCHFIPGGYVHDTSNAPFGMSSGFAPIMEGNSDLDFIFVQARIAF